MARSIQNTPVWVLGLALPLLAVGLWSLGSAASIEVKARIGQWLLEEAWSRTLAGETRVRPWPWADSWPIARLQAPGHGVDLIVLADASGRSLAWGPGHVSGTAEPAEPGLTLFGGHRDTHFRFLQAIEAGSRLSLQTADGRRHLYQVTDMRVVDARRAVMRSSGLGSTLALVTCYPFDAVSPGGPLRYLVHATMADDAPTEL